MKKFGIITLILLVSVFVLQSSKSHYPNDNEETGIQFTSGKWAEILQKAKEENKLIFLDAYASWCGPCKMMNKRVFSKEKIGKFYNKNFINVKIDMEKGEGPQLARTYKVRAYPSLYFIDHNGNVKLSAIGYQPPDKFLAMGKRALRK